MSRLRIFTVALIASILPAVSAAQAWPSKPIRMVVGYPPGGSTDVAGRLLAEHLSKSLGQQVIVENRAGAGGTVGASSVARAEPDGYTLMLAASPELSIAPIIVKTLAYDPVKDLQPISLVGQVPFVLVTHPSVPASTLAEFIAYAKANPGKLNYSSFGNNTSNHLFGELFKTTAQIEAVHVPYKGSGPSIADLIGGQIQYTFDTPPATLGQVSAGRLKAIAVATKERLPNAPNIPTLSESGLPGLTGGTWIGMVAPAKTPQPIIDRLNKEIVAALSSPELRKAFDGRGVMPSPTSPQEFGSFIQSEVGKWKTLAEKVGIVAE